MVVTTFLCGFQVGLSEIDEVYGKNFISWNDMKVDEHESGVIVVDKNGGGDSVTVQGAIDMVPENNKQRVKIYILPGIYRFVCIIIHKYSCFLRH